LKRFLDELVLQYNTPDFIPADPVSFPHRFRTDPDNCELVAFLAALLAYGRRSQILQTLDGVLARLGDNPRDYVEHFSAKAAKKDFADFVYRFNRGDDLVWLFGRLQALYGDFGSLEAAFAKAYSQTPDLQSALTGFMDALMGEKPPPLLCREGLKFLLPHPKNNGACKRLHLFLRWMVRQDAVDFGLWKALPASALLIPLDTHVARVARQLQLTRRASNDWKTAEEITAVFRTFCPEDPVKYDFALFGAGIAKDLPAYH
jgi:uncharacterized protein (TIGR02757 family)